jgi:hypothetical protein
MKKGEQLRMVIDLRYQIVTTVIIFLTLGIGILIGSSMVGQEGMIKEQKRLISYLEEDFSQLRKNNHRFQQRVQTLEKKLEKNNEFQKKIFPLVIKDRIEGSKVLIVYSGRNSDEVNEKVIKLNEILKIAGSKEIITKSLSDLNDNLNLAIYDYLICLGEKDKFSSQKIENKFQKLDKEGNYLSQSIFESRRQLMNYILELSGAFSLNQEGSN